MLCSFADSAELIAIFSEDFVHSKYFFFPILILGYRDQTDFPSMASFVYLVFGGRGLHVQRMSLLYSQLVIV